MPHVVVSGFCFYSWPVGPELQPASIHMYCIGPSTIPFAMGGIAYGAQDMTTNHTLDERCIHLPRRTLAAHVVSSGQPDLQPSAHMSPH